MINSVIYLLVFLSALSRSEASYFESLEAKNDDPRPVKISLVLDKASQDRLKAGALNVENSPTPVVFWHGMGDTAFGSVNIDRLALQRKYPNLTVLSVQIGENAIEDELGGYFINVNYQIDSVCRLLLINPVIKAHGAFNAIGFSQGAQFLRGLIQRCPLRENGIRPKNYISLGGQHQGVFGLPACKTMNVFCDHIRDLITHAVYESDVQEHLVQAEYWHDPTREEEYKHKNIFLADINNELHLNDTYKSNLLALDNMVLVEFLSDLMVIPRESSLFGFYEPGQAKKILPMEESSLYLEDKLGLRELYQSGRLHRISVPGQHLQYKMSWFMNEIAAVYLNN